MTLALGDATDTVVVYGTSANDVIAAGQNGLALNSDGDVDITASPGAFRLEIYGLEGNDVLNARGSNGAGLLPRPGRARRRGRRRHAPRELRARHPDRGRRQRPHRGAGERRPDRRRPRKRQHQRGRRGRQRHGWAGQRRLCAQRRRRRRPLGRWGARWPDQRRRGVDTAFYDADLDPTPVAVENRIPVAPPPPPPPPPGACSYDAATKAVTAQMVAGSQGTLIVAGAGEIHFGAVHVGVWPSDDGEHELDHDRRRQRVVGARDDRPGGRRLRPGATAETGASEIEIAVNLGDATDQVVVLGKADDDAISVGQNGVALNADGGPRRHVSPRFLPSWRSGAAAAGTRSLARGSREPERGSWASSCSSGAIWATLTGGDGADELNGGAGADLLEGRLEATCSRRRWGRHPRRTTATTS